MIRTRTKNRNSADIWPGFVDAISTLLLVLIFLLGLFLFSESVLSKLLSNKEDVLQGLNSQINQLSELLSLERRENRDLSDTISQLNRQLTQANNEADLFGVESKDLQDKNQELSVLLQEAELKAVIQAGENQELQESLDELLATLNATKVKLVNAEDELKLSEAAKKQVVLLNSQIASLRNQLAVIQKILDDTEKEIEIKKIQIVDLGKKLNTALAVKVGELNRYKSEFFGRLRTILGDRTDIEIVGDRFIFQSEVLFDSGSADLGEEGLAELSKLSRILLDITRKIPQDIPWVIQIQGHTDPRPIKTVRFPSNWELSTARAISVAKVFMIEGLSAAKISVAGFAEFQPLTESIDEASYRRNRRIEIKLTQP